MTYFLVIINVVAVIQCRGDGLARGEGLVSVLACVSLAASNADLCTFTTCVDFLTLEMEQRVVNIVQCSWLNYSRPLIFFKDSLLLRRHIRRH